MPFRIFTEEGDWEVTGRVKFALLAVTLVLSYLVAGHLDVFESFEMWTEMHEDLELDEVFVALFVTLVLVALFHVEQARRLARTVKQLRDAKRDLAAANATLSDTKLRAERASQAKSAFLANISHELRTPLNAILGFSELMQNETLKPINEQVFVRYAANIHQAGSHLRELIDDVLDLSKIEAGKYELNFEPVDLRRIAQQAFAVVGANSPGLASVSLELSQPLPTVYADTCALRQMLVNLLSNALKFTPAEGHVTLRITPGSLEELCIAVSDTGSGIDPHDIARVLSPFEQVSDPYTRTHKGTGLGLPITRQLAELHNGRVEIESVLGKGTTAKIYLPIDAACLTPAFLTETEPATSPLRAAGS